MTEMNRRDFVKTAIGGSLAATTLTPLPSVQGRILGANDRINVGVIGIGGRGMDLLRWAINTGQKEETSAQVVAVCDVYVKRKKRGEETGKCTGYLDYRDVLDRKDVDAVIIATPDHWHARMAIEALERGKDVYLEKPMTRTVEEAKRITETVKKTGRVLQIGSQTTSSDQWWKARKALQDNLIGKLILSQGSYHRNSKEGEWNWRIDPDAGPQAKGDDFIDWKMWLGDAPKRSFDADRFFRFRKYWDYSGGIATDLFYHVLAPLNICWGEAQFPYRVTGSGGIYLFKDGREVPDTFTLTADYAKGHSVVLTSTMANDTHIPGLIRGNEATIIISPNGRFESATPEIKVVPQNLYKKQFEEKHGVSELVIACETRPSHMENFLRCVRTRETPVLDAVTAYKAMVPIAMSVESYREGRVLYFDERKQKVVRDAPKS